MDFFVYSPSKPLFYSNLRRCGNTTRLVDYCIQALFTFGSVRVDGKELSYENELKHLEYLIKTRMASEHPLNDYVIRIDTRVNVLMAEIPFFSPDRYAYNDGVMQPYVVKTIPVESVLDAYKRVCKIAGVPQEIIDNPLLLSSRKPNDAEIDWANSFSEQLNKQSNQSE